MSYIKPREYNIVLDTKRGHRVPLINITEGDTKSVVFHITLTEKGKPIYIPDDAIVLLYFAKNDDTKTVQSTVDGSTFILDGKIICELKTNSIGVSDNTQVEVKVMEKNNGNLVTPTRFEFKVTDTIVCDEDVQSTNEYPLLLELIRQVEEMEEATEHFFGKSEVIEIQNTTESIAPLVTVFLYGFGDGGFGDVPFGGKEMKVEPCRIIYKNRGTITIQPNNTYKDMKIESVEKIKDGEFVVNYKDSELHFCIVLNQGVR